MVYNIYIGALCGCDATSQVDGRDRPRRDGATRQYSHPSFQYKTTRTHISNHACNLSQIAILTVRAGPLTPAKPRRRESDGRDLKVAERLLKCAAPCSSLEQSPCSPCTRAPDPVTCSGTCGECYSRRAVTPPRRYTIMPLQR